MKLIRYKRPELTAFDDIDRWFEEAFSNFGRWTSPIEGFTKSRLAAQPAADLYEDDDNYYVRYELPGVSKGDIKVELERNFLTLSGERKEKSNGEEKSFSFNRVVTVPEGIDGNKVAAKFQDGLLTVTLPKAEERKPKAISVK